MAWISVIDEKEAKGELKDIYEQLIKKRGKVANIMKIHSLNPPTMKAHMDLYLSIMFENSTLSREECELIAVVVSSENNCQYCMNHHSEALNFYWEDNDRIEKLKRDFRSVVSSRRELNMLEYAVKLTRKPDGVGLSDIEKLRKNDFSDRDILSINLIVSYFNFVNRIALGLGVEFTPEELTGYKF